jgi:hypothetical protein
VPHRDPDCTSVQRVGAPGAEHDRVDVESGGVAEDGPEVLVIVDPFEDSDCVGGADHL